MIVPVSHVCCIQPELSFSLLECRYNVLLGHSKSYTLVPGHNKDDQRMQASWWSGLQDWLYRLSASSYAFCNEILHGPNFVPISMQRAALNKSFCFENSIFSVYTCIVSNYEKCHIFGCHTLIKPIKITLSFSQLVYHNSYLFIPLYHCILCRSN